ncbi:hypothetical protein [Streptomyces virginiae]|uniref:hypothetical protein n=1 Tax=Streptomyces virginiae TaxID=1961 RepID=UPI0036E3EF3D
MLTDSSTAIDLNDAGVDLQEIDLLWDIPHVLTLARVRYANGTRYEFAYCRQNAEEWDFEVAREMVPHDTIPLQGWPSDTLGCGHKDEITSACWAYIR